MKKNQLKIYKAYYSPSGNEYHFYNKPTKDNLIIALANDCDYDPDSFDIKEFDIYQIKIIQN